MSLTFWRPSLHSWLSHVYTNTQFYTIYIAFTFFCYPSLSPHLSHASPFLPPFEVTNINSLVYILVTCFHAHLITCTHIHTNACDHYFNKNEILYIYISVIKQLLTKKLWKHLLVNQCKYTSFKKLLSKKKLLSCCSMVWLYRLIHPFPNLLAFTLSPVGFHLCLYK